jgi:hypothetical protein
MAGQMKAERDSVRKFWYRRVCDRLPF